MTTVLSAQNYTTRLADARGQLASRNVDSAAILLRAMASDPHADSSARAEAFMWLGVAIYYQGQDSSARVNFREALRYQPLLMGSEPLTRLDSLLGDWWEHEQTIALCGEALPAWGWPPKSASSSPMNAEARAGKSPEFLDHSPVRYPDHVRAAHIQGRVLARAIVNASGRTERGSVRILATPHPDLSRSVSQMMEHGHFSAAVSGDTAVRSCVLMPVDFSIKF